MTTQGKHTPVDEVLDSRCPACTKTYRGSVSICPLHEAAPDMLEALEKVRNLTDGRPVHADRRDWINTLVREAIRKAKGEV